MLPRRSAGCLLGAAIVSVACEALAEKALTATTLFRIARSKNANIVRYVARHFGRGLDPNAPIDGYWLMLAEDGRREALSWTERKLAYGFAVSNVSSEHCELRLLACPERPLSVERHEAGFRAILRIANKRAALTRIFVQATDESLLPRVKYLDLFGVALDGAPVHERLTA